MQLKTQALGQPAHQALFLVGPDLDRSIRVGRVERVRERRLTLERDRRARLLQHLTTHQPADGRRRQPAMRQPPARATHGTSRRDDARAAILAALMSARGSGLGKPGIERVAHPGIEAADFRHAGQQARARVRRIAATSRARSSGQALVGERVQIVVGQRQCGAHLTTFSGTRRVRVHAAQLFARAVQPRHHRTDRHALYARDFLIAQLLDRSEHQHLALVGRQPTDLDQYFGQLDAIGLRRAHRNLPAGRPGPRRRRANSRRVRAAASRTG